MDALQGKVYTKTKGNAILQKSAKIVCLRTNTLTKITESNNILERNLQTVLLELE